MQDEEHDRLGARLNEVLEADELTVGVAESLTGGSLSAALGRIRGSGDWFRGSVVAYSRSVKHGLLRVPEGPVVSEAAATAMAEHAAELLESDLTLAVTGVAGPDEQDGQPPGTVWMAVHRDGETTTSLLHLDGDPEDIVQETCSRGLAWLVDAAEGHARG
jgi:nicotinamide-nucleotide amidase